MYNPIFIKNRKLPFAHDTLVATPLPLYWKHIAVNKRPYFNQPKFAYQRTSFVRNTLGKTATLKDSKRR